MVFCSFTATHYTLTCVFSLTHSFIAAKGECGTLKADGMVGRDCDFDEDYLCERELEFKWVHAFPPALISQAKLDFFEQIE